MNQTELLRRVLGNEQPMQAHSGHHACICQPAVVAEWLDTGEHCVDLRGQITVAGIAEAIQ